MSREKHDHIHIVGQSDNEPTKRRNVTLAVAGIVVVCGLLTLFLI